MKACGGAKQLSEEHIEVLTTVTRGSFQLEIVEALYIRELCPAINMRDECRDH